MTDDSRGIITQAVTRGHQPATKLGILDAYFAAGTGAQIRKSSSMSLAESRRPTT